jgi:hypothetical protein
MTAEHVEYEDHTEREVLPFPVGYVDPHEQTGSDDEVAVVVTQKHLPLKARDKKWRLWFETETFTGEPFWIAAQPEDMGIPMFRTEDGLYSNGHSGRSGLNALSQLQLAIYKAEAHLHHVQAMQEYHRP